MTGTEVVGNFRVLIMAELLAQFVGHHQSLTLC